VGKRSKFVRRAGHFYPTPPAAVQPLLPYLEGIHDFAEPCAGDYGPIDCVISKEAPILLE
jgi:hypothetical protein